MIRQEISQFTITRNINSGQNIFFNIKMIWRNKSHTFLENGWKWDFFELRINQPVLVSTILKWRHLWMFASRKFRLSPRSNSGLNSHSLRDVIYECSITETMSNRIQWGSEQTGSEYRPFEYLQQLNNQLLDVKISNGLYSNGGSTF